MDGGPGAGQRSSAGRCPPPPAATGHTLTTTSKEMIRPRAGTEGASRRPAPRGRDGGPRGRRARGPGSGRVCLLTLKKNSRPAIPVCASTEEAGRGAPCGDARPRPALAPPGCGGSPVGGDAAQVWDAAAPSGATLRSRGRRPPGRTPVTSRRVGNRRGPTGGPSATEPRGRAGTGRSGRRPRESAAGGGASSSRGARGPPAFRVGGDSEEGPASPSQPPALVIPSVRRPPGGPSLPLARARGSVGNRHPGLGHWSEPPPLGPSLCQEGDAVHAPGQAWSQPLPSAPPAPKRPAHPCAPPIGGSRSRGPTQRRLGNVVPARPPFPATRWGAGTFGVSTWPDIRLSTHVLPEAAGTPRDSGLPPDREAAPEADRSLPTPRASTARSRAPGQHRPARG